jgi:hypothetical protein
MGFVRRPLDRFFITPKLEIQEQSILASPLNKILGVSPLSISSLKLAQSNAISEMDVLPIPTDMDFFCPDDDRVSKFKNQY